MTTCPICDKENVGRSDKKYCSDRCRAASHYVHRARATLFRKRTHKILDKNRNILAGLNPQGKSTVSRIELENLSFNFRFFSSVYRTKGGNVYWFCYDQGYRKIKKGDKYLLIKWQDYMWGI